MAKLMKRVKTRDLTEDTTSIMQSVKSYLLPDIEYSSDILDYARDEYSNPELAVILSGSTDKKSKEYKAAIRSVQLWKQKGSTPSKKYQQRLVRGLGENDKLPESALQGAISKKTGATITINSWVQISNSPPEHRTLKATLDESELQDFLQATIEGDQISALDIYARAKSEVPYPSFTIMQGQGVTTSIHYL